MMNKRKPALPDQLESQSADIPFWARFRSNIRKNWYKFARNKMSVAGLVIVVLVVAAAIFAPWITPYPKDVTFVTNFDKAYIPPSADYWLGSDNFGRDIFTRIIFAFRGSLLMAIVVLALTVPFGVILGLIAGYFKNTWIETVIMRITDIFLGVPPLILAMAIAAVLSPNLMNAMIAVSISWWPWYTRIAYGMASSLRNEYFVIAAELTGASKFHILFREILPNCMPPVLTKVALDVGWVILVSASLSFIGLGEQPPTPALGQMVSDGARYLPALWWGALFPAFAIVIIILGFNLVGDGVADMMETKAG